MIKIDMFYEHIHNMLQLIHAIHEQIHDMIKCLLKHYTR